MNNLIDQKFLELKKKGRKALISFITAGDPDIETSYRIMEEMMTRGVDLIEVGVPFSDPVAEGPTIEQASARALAAGTTTEDVFALVKRFQGRGEVPILLMLYLNLIYKYGVKEFMGKARDAGVSGLIVPDIPLEELEEILPLAKEYNLTLINLIAPSTGPLRMKKILERSQGFVYCVSSMGVTGVRNQITTDLKAYYERIRSLTTLPLALGFGLKNREQIEGIEGDWDGYILGSAIVNIVAREGAKAPEAVGDFIDTLKELK